MRSIIVDCMHRSNHCLLKMLAGMLSLSIEVIFQANIVTITAAIIVTSIAAIIITNSAAIFVRTIAAMLVSMTAATLVTMMAAKLDAILDLNIHSTWLKHNFNTCCKHRSKHCYKHFSNQRDKHLKNISAIFEARIVTNITAIVVTTIVEIFWASNGKVFFWWIVPLVESKWDSGAESDSDSHDSTETKCWHESILRKRVPFRLFHSKYLEIIDKRSSFGGQKLFEEIFKHYWPESFFDICLNFKPSRITHRITYKFILELFCLKIQIKLSIGYFWTEPKSSRTFRSFLIKFDQFFDMHVNLYINSIQI